MPFLYLARDRAPADWHSYSAFGRPDLRDAETGWRAQDAVGTIAYRSISRDLFFGFETKRTANRLWVYEAYPEKALLDLIYLNGRTGSGIRMDFDFGRLDPVRLAAYVSRFPKWVALALAKLRTTHTTVS